MCLKTLDALSYTSILGVLAIVYIGVLTVLYGNDVIDGCEGHKDKCPGEIKWEIPCKLKNFV